jgi:putative N-acetylmannosamine-6-phosphate epimerase
VVFQKIIRVANIVILVCKHTRTPESCGLREPEKNLENLQQIKKNLQDSSVKVIGVYNNNLAHTIYVIAETDSVEELQKVVAPILTMGTFEVLPVEDSTYLFR